MARTQDPARRLGKRTADRHAELRHVRVSDRTWARLRALSTVTGESMARIIRGAIEAKYGPGDPLTGFERATLGKGQEF